MREIHRGHLARLSFAAGLFALACLAAKAEAQATLPAEGADVVFIYDNSASMWPHHATIDSSARDTAFFQIGTCAQTDLPEGTPLTYATAIGPRTVRLVPSPRLAQCAQKAGDPYLARASILSRAIDDLAARFPNSTAGAVALAREPSHAQAPLPLSTPGDADRIKASLAMDSLPWTYYVPVLQLAMNWLKDGTLIRTARQAIVFLSDGEPNDAPQLAKWMDGNPDIPIYTIGLGDSSASFTQMEGMSARTGGDFHRIDPRDVGGMSRSVQEIVRTIASGKVTASIGDARRPIPATGPGSGGTGAIPGFRWPWGSGESVFDVRGRRFPPPQ